MPYKFATKNEVYSDYASGRVFYAAPRHPMLPVRLVSELFQRCQAIRNAQGQTQPATIYDPCCGSAYHLCSLAYLHWHEIAKIIGSDVDATILNAARRNLSLLTIDGLAERKGAITQMHIQHGKPSHADALVSVQHFEKQLRFNLQSHAIETAVFEANALHPNQIEAGLAGEQPDIVLADVPYGQMSGWISADSINSAQPETTHLLTALFPNLTTQTVVAIITDKAQKCSHPNYRQLERFQIGKRRVFLLQPSL